MRYTKTVSITTGLLYLLILFSADRIHNHKPTLFPQDNCPSYVLSVTSKADDYGFYPDVLQRPFQPVLFIFFTEETPSHIILNLSEPSRAPPFCA